MSTLFPDPTHVPPLNVTLRDYQTAAVDALFDWFGTRDGNPLVVVPTGGGKSIIIAAFMQGAFEVDRKTRIVCLTHVRELISQNHAALLRAWPGAPAGIYSAGLRRREHDAPILFAGIQSVYDKCAKVGWADLVLIDEAHLIPRSGMGMYQQFLRDAKSINSKLKVIGFTATPFRTGDGRLDRGEDRMFDGVAYNCSLLDLIGKGWLSKVTAKAPPADATIDTSAVHVRAGDFVESELQDAAMDGGRVAAACREIVARSKDRRAWLVFCCGVEHAKAVAVELERLGISVATVFGDTAKEERDAATAAIRSGKVRAIVNVNVLTTGFDAPNIDLIALLRPTMSPVLYVQMVGRGLRIADGKDGCLVLDFGGNVVRHGPIDAINVHEPKKGGDEMVLARACPECGTLVAIAASECPECGYVFPLPEPSGPTHSDKPEDAAILSSEAGNPIERWDVTYWKARRHEKAGKAPTMCVEYEGGFGKRVREWVCFEHLPGSFPHRKAMQWWTARGGSLPGPVTVEEALVRIEMKELRDPVTIVVDTRGQWPSVIGVRMEREVGEDDAVNAPAEPAAEKVQVAGEVDYGDLPF